MFRNCLVSRITRPALSTSERGGAQASENAQNRPSSIQLGPLRILAGGSVSKGSVQGQPFELANLVLIQGADAQVADLLAFRRPTPSTGPRCPNRLFNLRHYPYDNSESDSITTFFRRISDVGLGDGCLITDEGIRSLFVIYQSIK